MSPELPGPPFPAHAPDVLPRWRAGPRSAIQTEKQAWQPALPDRGWVDALLRAGEAEAGETEAGGRGEGGCRGWELDVLTDTENWLSWAACCWAPIPPAPSPRFWGDWKAHQGPMCSPPVLARAPGAGRGWGGQCSGQHASSQAVLCPTSTCQPLTPDRAARSPGPSTDGHKDHSR